MHLSKSLRAPCNGGKNYELSYEEYACYYFLMFTMPATLPTTKAAWFCKNLLRGWCGVSSTQPSTTTRATYAYVCYDELDSYHSPLTTTSTSS
jgi:hypothetical protein